MVSHSLALPPTSWKYCWAILRCSLEPFSCPTAALTTPFSMYSCGTVGSRSWGYIASYLTSLPLSLSPLSECRPRSRHPVSGSKWRGSVSPRRWRPLAGAESRGINVGGNLVIGCNNTCRAPSPFLKTTRLCLIKSFPKVKLEVVWSCRLFNSCSAAFPLYNLGNTSSPLTSHSQLTYLKWLQAFKLIAMAESGKCWR